LTAASVCVGQLFLQCDLNLCRGLQVGRAESSQFTDRQPHIYDGGHYVLKLSILPLNSPKMVDF